MYSCVISLEWHVSANGFSSPHHKGIRACLRAPTSWDITGSSGTWRSHKICISDLVGWERPENLPFLTSFQGWTIFHEAKLGLSVCLWYYMGLGFLPEFHGLSGFFSLHIAYGNFNFLVCFLEAKINQSWGGGTFCMFRTYKRSIANIIPK